ncbi:MAG: ABC transporter substrate-binding protein [Rhodospirillaceae bacterium]
MREVVGMPNLLRIFLRTVLTITKLFIVTGLISNSVNAETIRIAASTPLTSYADPLAIDSGNGLIPSIFDGLTSVGADGTVRSALAESWSATSDTTWVFRLKRNIVFHDGSPFNASSVVDVLNLLRAPEALVYPIAPEATSIAGTRIIDPFTVEITTHRADGLLARKLSLIPIFPVNVWIDMGRTEFSKHPIGTGPYSILNWGRGGSSQVTMIGEANSWRAPKQIDRIEYVILPDSVTRMQSLMAGEVDIANSIDPDSISLLEAAGYRIYRQPHAINLAIAFYNCGGRSSPTTDRRVRLALNMAVNKNRIVDNLLSGTTEVATQGGTPGVLGYNPDIKPYAFDPTAARSLLAEAGYSKGLNLVVGVFSGQFPSDSLIFQQVAQDWAAIGVNAKLQSLAFADFSRRIQTGEWDGIDAFSAVWSHYQIGDVSRALKQFSGGAGRTYFCAPELLDEMIDSDSILDEAAREATLKDLMARHHDLVPSLPLVRYISLNALSSRILDFKSETGRILFEEMQVAPSIN